MKSLFVQSFREFSAWAIQQCGADAQRISKTVNAVQRELSRIKAPYKPIHAFTDTVFVNGKLAKVNVCKWFFLAFIDSYFRDNEPIPERAGLFLVGGNNAQSIMMPMVVSRFRKLQKYDFKITAGRIDDAISAAVGLMFNAVEGNRFIIPQYFRCGGESVTINGIDVDKSVNIEHLESARLSGDWIGIYAIRGQKLPRCSPFPRLNIVRAAVSVATRRIVEMTIGRSLGKRKVNSVSIRIASDYGIDLSTIVERKSPPALELPDFFLNGLSDDLRRLYQIACSDSAPQQKVAEYGKSQQTYSRDLNMLIELASIAVRSE